MIQWYYLAIISSILMGIATIQEKRALKKEYASAYSSDFAVIAAIMSLVLIPFANFSNITIIAIVGLYVLSLFSTISYLLTARTYRHGSLSVTTASYSALPSIFTVILAFVFLDEKLNIIQYISVVVMAVATYLILFMNPKSSQPSFDKKKYIYVVIASSLANAGGAIVLKYLLASINPLTILIIMQIFAAFNYMAYMHIKYGGITEIIKNFRSNKLTLTLQAAFTTSYRATYYIAAGLAAISLVSPLRNTAYVIMAIVAGGVVFKEKNMARKAILAAILIVAAYFLVV